MALSLTIGQVRALPYPEYKSWELFYMLEPWGWQEDEYHFAMVPTMLSNFAQAGKGKRKSVKDYMRNTTDAVLERIRQIIPSIEVQMSEDEKKAKLIEQVKKDFGIK